MSNSVAKLLAALCLLLPPLRATQADTPEALNGRATSAYQAKDYATFLILEKQILTLNPGDPKALYNVASGEALLGHAEESVAMLDKLLALHLDFKAEKDSDFAGILKTPPWARYQDHLAAMRKPVVQSAVAFTLPEKGLLASSVAVDSASGDVYVSSLRGRKIIKRTKQGVVSDFAVEKDGLLGVSSLLIDTARHQLFASMAAVPFMQNYRKADEGKAGICVFDLASGKLIRSAFLFAAGERHALAQMAEDKSGNIFVLDTGSSEIHRLRRSSSELELFLSSVVFRAPRGLALSADERTLYVDDLATGIWAVDVLSIDRAPLAVPSEFWIGGLSGLFRVADGFVSLQSGAEPNRLVRIRLNAKGDSITAVETLESNHPAYAGPVPGNLAGTDFWYIANSQLDLLDPKTGAFPVDRAAETIILRLPLSN